MFAYAVYKCVVFAAGNRQYTYFKDVSELSITLTSTPAIGPLFLCVIRSCCVIFSFFSSKPRDCMAWKNVSEMTYSLLSGV